MAEKRTIELEVKDNASSAQQQFENLRQQIAKTTQEVDELTQAYGENSQEVTDAKNKLNELTTSYTNLNKVATDTGATFADVYGEMQPLTTRMGEAEDRLYELALAGQTASKEYQDLLAATQNYLRVQQQVDLQVEAGAVPAAQKMTMAVGGVAGAFGVAEGATALFGVESQKLQETMMRLQAALTITQSLASIKEAIPTFQALGQSAKAALSGIRTGIAATGVGLFVVALGTVVAYWDDIKLAVSGVSNEQQKLNKELDKDIAKQEHKRKMLDAQENILKLQGVSEKQIIQYKIQAIAKDISLAETQFKRAKQNAKIEYDAAVRNQEITKAIIRIGMEGAAFTLRAIAAPFDLLIEGANKLAETLGFSKISASNVNAEINKIMEKASEWQSKVLFDPKATKDKSDATLRELELGLQQMKNEKAGFEIEIQELGKQGAAASSSIASGAAQEQIDITRQMEEEKNRLMEEGRAKELDALRIKYKYEQQEADKNFKEGKLKKADYDKLTAQMTESKRLDEKAINEKYDKIEKDERAKKLEEQIKAEDAAWLELQKARNSQREQELLDLQLAYDAKIEAANGNAEAEKAITERFNKDYAAINEKYRKEEAEKKKEQDEKEKERIKKLNEYRVQSVEDSLQIVSNLAELFAGKSVKQQKKAFQVQKAVNIASAVVDTYKAANAALGSSPPPFNFIAMAASITAGLLNVKKIASQKFEGDASSGGGGGGSNAPATAPMTANFSTIGSSGINQLAQLQQQPTQAYVVSGEVTSAQALDRNRVQNATL